MRVAYVEITERGLSETLGPQPRQDAELDWDWAISEFGTPTRLHNMREGDVLKRAEFEGPDGPVTVSLIDDGSW